MPTALAPTAPNTGYVGSEQQYSISVTSQNLGPLGYFDKFSGGDSDAKVTVTRAGGTFQLASYLSLPDFTTLTVSRDYRTQSDPQIVAQLRTVTGLDFITVTVQPLDQNMSPFGPPTTFNGRLSQVKTGTADSTSGNPRVFELDVAVETVAN